MSLARGLDGAPDTMNGAGLMSPLGAAAGRLQ
jgi:hypothetical protein